MVRNIWYWYCSAHPWLSWYCKTQEENILALKGKEIPALKIEKRIGLIDEKSGWKNIMTLPRKKTIRALPKENTHSIQVKIFFEPPTPPTQPQRISNGSPLYTPHIPLPLLDMIVNKTASIQKYN